MILKNNMLLYSALLLCLPSLLSANITTLQYWDPIPFFNAANLNMPPDTQFCYMIKQRLLDESNDKHRRWGINFSPFVQKAIRAQQTDNLYYGVSGNSTGVPGLQMSDFKGTPYLMGLFLGQDANGNSIWGGKDAKDNGDVSKITAETIDATLLPLYLKNAVKGLNDIDPITGHHGQNAIIYNTPTNLTSTAPSILSQGVLQQDITYFGAFSTPLSYQKAGFRWELNFDISNSIGFLVRGGFVQLTQRALPEVPLSALGSATQTGTGLPSLYTGLNTVANGGNGTGANGSIPQPIAQATFNDWVPNNIDDLLDPVYGTNYSLLTYTEPGLEDIQLLGFFRHTFPIHPVDPNKYASILVTPYAMLGWTIPIAGIQNYAELYALPLGNNSHTSLGGVVGVTFDFIESIEIGFEFGATAFLEKLIPEVPCPNHILQRVIFPYRRNMYVTPGTNAQFAFIFNAFEFTENSTFSFRYNYVQHAQDTIVLEVPNPYFLPEQLAELTPWTSQMFIAALTFEIQPSIYVSIAWQGALSQKNAYCSNSILGSLNFQF